MVDYNLKKVVVMPFAPSQWLSGVSPFAIPVEVESTITEDPGQPARVEDVSEDPNLVALRFYVPEGLQGIQGVPGLDAADPIFTAEVSSHGPSTTPSVTVSGVYPNKLLSFYLRDGAEGPTGPAGPQGSPGLSSSVFAYQFQTAATAPPGDGHVRLNFNPPSGATGIYVSHIDGNGIDQSIILANIQPNSVVTIQKSNDDSVYARFVSFGLTTFVGYSEILVNYDSRAGTLTNNMQIILVVQIAGPQGPQGDPGTPGSAATIVVQSTSTGAPGSNASVVNVGSSSAAQLVFTVPRGDVGATGPTGSTGAPGTSATIAVQSTTTGAPGTSASVVNIGTSSAAQLEFTIPRGDVGATGPQGNPGTNGTSATIAVQSTTTGAPGTSASVVNNGTSSAVQLAFTIPRGDVGATGPQGDPGTNGTSATITVGTVTTGSPGSSVTVSNSGTSSAAVFDFSIPQGATGSGSSITINNVTNSVAYRLLFTNATSGTAATALNTIASALTYNPSTLALTNTGGSISCSSVTATNFTGLASSATAITTTATTTLSDRYICFTNTVGASASVNVCSAISNQLLFNAGSTTLTVGNGTGGVGIITTNTLNAATVNGNATSATAVAVTSTSVASARYLMFTSSTTGNAAVQVSSALANQIYVTPATPNLMIGNGTTGTGSVTCNTVSCTTMNGQASAADQVGIIATTTNSTRYLLFTPSNNSTVANASVQSAVALTYNPGTTTLTATNLTVLGTLTGTVSSATTATNIAGGSAGSIPYQTAVNVTALLAAGTAGTQLRSTGTSSAPAWSTPGGFCVTYCGTVTATTQLLCYGLPYALIGSATLNTTLGSSQSIFVTPYSGIIVAASGFNTTSSATATATVHVNGSATALLTIAAGQFTATAARSLTLSSTTQTVSAGQTIEVRINTAVTGSTQITLYIA